MAAAQPAQQQAVSAIIGADTSNATLLDLPPSIYDRCLSLLPPRDLCTATQVCKALAAAGTHDLVWRAAALSRWPTDCITLHGSYATYKELTLDDNRRNTAWYYPLEPGTSSNYKYAHDDHFYQCRLIGMERPRDGSKELRVYYDARGESDLREADTLMLMWRLHLGGMAANRTVSHIFVPEEVVEFASIPGHSKGCFMWGARIAAAVDAVMAVQQDAGATVVVRREAVLSYACSPVDLHADYSGATILDLQQGQGFEEVWRAGAVLTAKGAMGRQLAAEGEEEQRRRWADLPQGVKARGNGWPGADGFGAWPKEGQ